MIVTCTDGATPFRLVTHIGDVGHTLIVGPTGMGKSVLLATLAMQFRRYPGSRIFAFDMGRSMRATILGLGGEHYDLGTDGDISFQPLVRIDQESYRTWAAEWLEGRMLREGATIGPDEKAAIWSALESLAGAPVEQRTLTGFSVLLHCARRWHPTCSAAPTAVCSMPTATGWARPTCRASRWRS